VTYSMILEAREGGQSSVEQLHSVLARLTWP